MLVTPFTVVAQEDRITKNLKDEADVEELVAQLRVVIDEILHKYGHNPMIGNLCNMILNALGKVGRLFFCILIIIITVPILTLMLNGYYWGLPAALVYMSYYIFIRSVYMAMLICPFYWYPTNLLISSKLPFKTIYTLSEINDITNLTKGCPCLQE